jgi:hypothetical protein
VNGKILLGVVFLNEEAGGGIELLGIRLFVYGDFPDRSEALFLRFPVMVSHGPRLWFFLPEPSLAVDQVDLLEVQHKLVIPYGHDQVVGLGGAADQAAVGNLLDAVALGAGHGVYFPAKIEVDAMICQKSESRPFTVNMPDEL